MEQVRAWLDRMSGGEFSAVRKEIDDLDDLGLLPELREVLEGLKDSVDKNHCYLILGLLARNLGDGAGEVVDYLATRPAKEKTQSLKAEALDWIKFGGGGTEPGPLLEALGKEKPKLRERIIDALGAFPVPAAEEALVELLGHENLMEVASAIVALARIGTGACAEALEETARRVPRDRRHEGMAAGCILGLGRIAPERALPLVREALEEQPNQAACWASLNVAAAHGGDAEVPGVLARLRALMKKKPQQRNFRDQTYLFLDHLHEYGDEFTAAVRFLERVGAPEGTEYLEALRKAPDKLLDLEKQALGI